MRVVCFTRTAEGELVLLTMYAKSKTDNLSGSRFIGQLPFGKELDAEQVYPWFAQAAYRPEILGGAVDALVYDLDVRPGQFAEKLHRLIQE